MEYINRLLNSITMYRVVLYGLLAISANALILSLLGLLSYNPLSLIAAFIIVTTTCFYVNILFAKLFKATVNTESSLITALILFLILSPVANIEDAVTLVIASIIAMGSKYIFTIHKKHIFNPAAFAAFLLGLFGNGNAIWWAGSSVLLPVVAIAGFLIVKKIRRYALVLSSIIASVVVIVLYGISYYISPLTSFMEAFVSWPLVFFVTVMLTEPLTTPPTRTLQILYGTLVGLLFGIPFHFGPIFSTPELSLLIGNIFSYIVSPKEKLFLALKEKKQLSEDIYEFSFPKKPSFNFTPGQYLEWTLPMTKTDNRGNRRYFTIASSPTEDTIKLGVKIQTEHSSSFKKALMKLTKGDSIIAAQLAGDFTMSADTRKKLVFIAGGIGVTPFRSMIKYLVDTNQKRDAILFYQVSHPDELAYVDIFENAAEVGVTFLPVVTKQEHVEKGWKGKTGHINESMIKEIPDFKQRIYYISGPDPMVRSYKKLLISLGIAKANIVTDYFPGF